jgi:hypothetical protein
MGGSDARSERYNEASYERTEAYRARLTNIGDILQWDQLNKNYILTHGVSGVDWRFYKIPRSELVFDVYMRYWRDVKISP